MKWFQHYSDSYTNLKLQELIHDTGMEGYGLFWICCELVAQQGENYSINNGKNWKKMLSTISTLDSKKVEQILEVMGLINLIDRKRLNKGVLFIPKMEEYSDDYTKRHQRVSEQTTDNVPLDKIRPDKIRLDKTIKKDQYGESKIIQLSKDEHKKLVDLMGENNLNILIGEMDDYLGASGKKYKSHYHALRQWARRKVKEGKDKKGGLAVL